MPTYEYRCGTCGHQFEVFAKMSDPAPAACESCGAATLEKVLFAPAVHYKGSGFYSTDYSGKRSTAPSGSSESTSSTEQSSSDAGSSGSTGSGSDTGSSSSSSTGSSDA